MLFRCRFSGLSTSPRGRRYKTGTVRRGDSSSGAGIRHTAVARGAASQLLRSLGFLAVVTSSEIRPDGLGEHWREESFGADMIAAPIVLDANARVVGEIDERNLLPCKVFAQIIDVRQQGL